MAKPILMAVDDEAEALKAVEQALRERYDVDYEVAGERSAESALRTLAQLREAGREVAILLSDQWMPEMTGVEFLTRAHEEHPEAQRALLITWGDRSCSNPILQAMAFGQIDYYLPKPWGSPDEQFHRHISEFLEEWSRFHGPKFEAVRVVGERWSPRSYELRDLLDRNGIPCGFYDQHSEEGRSLLQHVQRPDGPFPVVIFLDGTVLTDPSNEAAADALHASDRPQEGVYDLTIIGAGPAGLSAAVYGASEGLSTMVIEREALGGQAGTSSHIRNYLGFPRGISGAELAARAYQQAWLFGASYYFMRQVTHLHADGSIRRLILSDGAEIATRCVVLAMGMSYRRLGIPNLEALIGAGVFYGTAATDAQAMKGQDVFVGGAGNAAGQAAVHLARYAKRVTMLVRGRSLAESMSEYLIQQIAATSKIEVRLHTQILDGLGQGSLQGLVLRNTVSGAVETVPVVALFVLIGTELDTGWLPQTIARDEEGFILTGRNLLQGGQPPPGWELDRLPYTLETNLQGVFAAGDVRHGSAKRVASAVGEGSITIQLVHQYLGESY